MKDIGERHGTSLLLGCHPSVVLCGMAYGNGLDFPAYTILGHMNRGQSVLQTNIVRCRRGEGREMTGRGTGVLILDNLEKRG